MSYVAYVSQGKFAQPIIESITNAPHNRASIVEIIRMHQIMIFNRRFDKCRLTTKEINDKTSARSQPKRIMKAVISYKSMLTDLCGSSSDRSKNISNGRQRDMISVTRARIKARMFLRFSVIQNLSINKSMPLQEH
jgi:hypothetical protein